MAINIQYSFDIKPAADLIIDLYDKAGLPRPTRDSARIQTMYDHSNLVVTAWDNERLIGVSRSITDWVWSCYLADLAIHPDYQKMGIGKELIRLTKEKLGAKCMILLLSVPDAMTYYPKIGMVKEDRAFTIFRTE